MTRKQISHITLARKKWLRGIYASMYRYLESRAMIDLPYIVSYCSDCRAQRIHVLRVMHLDSCVFECVYCKENKIKGEIKMNIDSFKIFEDIISKNTEEGKEPRIKIYKDFPNVTIPNEKFGNIRMYELKEGAILHDYDFADLLDAEIYFSITNNKGNTLIGVNKERGKTQPEG